MKFYLRRRNILVALLVTALVIIGGFIMQANPIVTLIAALIGGLVILTAKHLGNEPTPQNSTQS